MDKKKENKIEYELHKWKKPLLIIDFIFSIVVIILIGLIRPDYIVIATYFLIIIYLIISERKEFFYHLLIASFISFCWMIIAKNEYGYNHDYLTIYGFNTFPLFSWAIGLFAIYVLYSHFEHVFKEKGFIKKLMLFSILYIPILIFIETISYYLFDIRNLATSQFPGLPICNCIHAAWWMQLSYLLLGPIFFSLCYLLKLENPHYKIKKFKKRHKPSNKHGRNRKYNKFQ